MVKGPAALRRGLTICLLLVLRGAPCLAQTGRQTRLTAPRMLAEVTCHAGFVTGWRTTDTIIDRLNRTAGAAVFSASRGEEASIERADWGHGAFTKGLLDGLAGQADSSGDGAITLEELQAFVVPRVEQLTENRQHPYLPRLQDFEPQAVIARTMR